MYKKLTVIFISLLGGLIVIGAMQEPELRESGKFVAYRGGGQLVDYQKLAGNGCTAHSIVRSENSHIENTIESIDDANNAGFHIFHINIHRSQDDRFVVFHDWTLDCATNGSGEVRASSTGLLSELDAGYGYTFDDGKSFPFREKGYRISRLETVLDKYPDKPFWLNIKNNDEASFSALYEMLTRKYKNRLSRMVIITSEQGVRWFQKKDPALVTLSTESTKDCLKRYVLYGWTGIFPKACANRPILIPPSKVKYLWGYPKKFAALAQKNGSEVFLWTEHTSVKSQHLEIENGVGVVTGDIYGVGALMNK